MSLLLYARFIAAPKLGVRRKIYGCKDAEEWIGEVDVISGCSDYFYDFKAGHFRKDCACLGSKCFDPFRDGEE